MNLESLTAKFYPPLFCILLSLSYSVSQNQIELWFFPEAAVCVLSLQLFVVLWREFSAKSFMGQTFEDSKNINQSQKIITALLNIHQI